MSNNGEPKPPYPAPAPRKLTHRVTYPQAANLTNDARSTIRNQRASRTDNQVLKAPTSREDIYYKMDHDKRGTAVIFNHTEFENDRETPRAGSQKDCDALEECLMELGFEVDICPNYDHNAIKVKLETVAGNDHSQSDCLFIAVLTHGDLGILSANDEDYGIDEIFSPFTGDKCTDLAGKPKIFVIQACQGTKEVEVLFMESPTTADSRITNMDAERLPQDSLTTTFNMPNEADFIIAYATPPGYVALRHPTDGSIFIRALCVVLKAHGTEHDLGTVFTFVCNLVALQYRNQKRGERQQIPCITSRLTHLIQF